jgi:cephalosporin-C deacetylase
MRKRILIALLATAFISVFAQAEFDPIKSFIKGWTDKGIATDYKAGEEITFTLQADFAGQEAPKDCFIHWKRSGDDQKVETGKVPASTDPIIIKTSLDKPGFVRVEAYLRDKDGKMIHKPGIRGEGNKVFFDGGAGVEIEKLHGLPEPEDFDAFWAKQRERLAQVPLKPELTPMPSDNPQVKIFAVSIPCPGPNNRPTTGFLTIPVDAKPKSLPAHAHFHGYGTHIQRAPRNGATNAIHFNVNAHGYDLNKEDQYYKDFFESIRSNGHGYAFDPKQNENPENAYFNGMALRLMRAFEFLKSLPEWDGKTLSSHGGSQGGLQSVWAGALEPQLTQTNPGIPWCADLGGKTVGRLAGGWNIPYVKGVDYYDCVNMAKRIPATCFVNITRAGLGDYCCPPSGVAMIYNNVKGPKRIFWVQGSTHGYVPPSPNQTYVITNQDAEVK